MCLQNCIFGRTGRHSAAIFVRHVSFNRLDIRGKPLMATGVASVAAISAASRSGTASLRSHRLMQSRLLSDKPITSLFRTLEGVYRRPLIIGLLLCLKLKYVNSYFNAHIQAAACSLYPCRKLISTCI